MTRNECISALREPCEQIARCVIGKYNLWGYLIADSLAHSTAVRISYRKDLDRLSPGDEDTTKIIWNTARRIARRKLQWLNSLVTPDRMPHMPADEMGPEEMAEARDQIATGLSALDQTQRAVIVLRYFYEFRLPQVEWTLGLKPGHAAVITFRAVQKMREKLRKPS